MIIAEVSPSRSHFPSLSQGKADGLAADKFRPPASWFVIFNSLFQYRALTDFRVPPPARETRARLQPPPDIVFGKPSRPRSPIYDVIEHKFQRNWLIHQKMRDEARQEVKIQSLLALLKSHLTSDPRNHPNLLKSVLVEPYSEFNPIQECS